MEQNPKQQQTTRLWKETEHIGGFGTYSCFGYDTKTGKFVQKIYSIEKMILECRRLPVYSVFLESLDHHLDDLCWLNIEGNKISPNLVLNNPKLHTSEFKRMMKSDLFYPIIMSQDKKTIYDGMYRLARSFYEKHFYIKVFLLPECLR